MRTTFSSIVLALCCLASSDAFALKKTIIDSRLDACLEKANTTTDMIRCNSVAYSEWDKQLNRTYGELLSTMSATEKQSLRASQRSWLAFRDLEFKAIDAMFARLDGTMYLPMRVTSRTNIVRNRAIELVSYQALRSN
jgi:uncharacterized protein YecT (DUF1311 family)